MSSAKKPMISAEERSAEPSEQQRIDEVYEQLKTKTDSKLRQMAEEIVRGQPQELFNETEFALRDHVLNIGKQAHQIAIDEAKKNDI